MTHNMDWTTRRAHVYCDVIPYHMRTRQVRDKNSVVIFLVNCVALFFMNDGRK